ncbi:MAG TPA: patatin-like phospholipase family protein [Chondromyces sp.]|nr:patatin-like phospholipase family protein [Chondromyces sp.]
MLINLIVVDTVKKRARVVLKQADKRLDITINSHILILIKIPSISKPERQEKAGGDCMIIDGVFSGGGIKGFALIGAYQAIEEKGYSFARLAGTSAGSIIAAFIAAGYTSKEIINLLDEVDLVEFLETGIWEFSFLKWVKVYLKLGLYKADKLEEWLEKSLAAKGVRTFSDLPPDGLKVIASDLTNGRLLVLPDDLLNYKIDPRSFSVARAVRMSCSIPYFFEPTKLRSPDGKAVIVDGGVLSNFPMWLFDKDEKKPRPVLGIKLSPQQSEMPKRKINNALEMFNALFQTMKDAHDNRYISRKHEKNIVFIPTAGIAATDFNLSDQKKDALVEAGRKQTDSFLERWCYT